MNILNDKLSRSRRREVRRQRFAASLRDMTTYHRAKALIPMAYLLVVAFAWMNRGRIFFPVIKENPLIYHSISFVLLLVALLVLVEIIIAIGTPRGLSKFKGLL